MLYLHCGWPRTSTSSLQAALGEHRNHLASVGIVYPEKWMTATGLGMTHRGLVELLKASAESDGAFDDFKGYLSEHRDQDVLFSAEILTEWLLAEDKQDALLALLSAAREVMPVKCVWALRRIDDATSSLYLRPQAVGAEVPRLAEQLESVYRLDYLFGGMRRIGDVLEDDVVYVKYDPDGGHNEQLLRAFDMPEQTVSAIVAKLEGSPRLNAQLSHKQVVALVHVDALSARAGVDLDSAVLRKAFYGGKFIFEQDWPCELVAEEVTTDLQERALAAANRQGFAPYSEFFGQIEINGSSPTVLEPDAITDRDLRQLMDHLDAVVPTEDQKPGVA